MEPFNYNLSDESDQDAITTEKYICIIILFLLTKGFIDRSLTTMWDNTDVCENQYHCASAIYLLSCLDL